MSAQSVILKFTVYSFRKTTQHWKGSDVTNHTEEKYVREPTWLEPFEALGSSPSVGVVEVEFVVVGLTLSESVESWGLAGWGFFGGLPGRPFFFFMGTTESSPWLVET